MYLGDFEMAADMCRPRRDPVQRTIFIDEFLSFHGELVALADLVPAIDDPHLRSAMCLGVGSIPFEDVPPNAQSAWQPRIATLHRNAPDTGTHSASG